LSCAITAATTVKKAKRNVGTVEELWRQQRNEC
jgi:hypothetical protein